jgi:hypothetical protein
MPLLGNAAMLLSFDVDEDAIPEHDDWHTHEHLPERLAIPGFLRGTRWVSLIGRPRYMVLYEVEQLQTLTSDSYLERLNNPSEWTSRMMQRYRGMSRGFCHVTGSSGCGMGHACVLLRFEPRASYEASLRQWLVRDCLPQMTATPGIGSAFVLEGAITPSMTNEQRIRGADAPVDWAVIVTGYRQKSLEDLFRGPLQSGLLERQGASEPLEAIYRQDYALTSAEVDV